MRRERVKTKRGFKGFGVFILGWFIGLISTLGILFGVGYWAYTSINLKKLEKWTKSEITDNQGLEDLTLKKAVAIVQGINKNGSNAYTLAQLEEDFNLKLLDDSIYGIDLTQIKTSSLKNIKDAFDDTIDSITFNNVLSFMETDQEELGVINTILENDVTYYVYNGKLYEDKEHSVEVEFKYTIKDNTVQFANGSHTISTFDGVQTISPRLRDLPLNNAVESMSDVTMDLKIYELLDYERTGVEGDYQYTKDGNSVSGVMASLAEYTINDLSDQDKLNNIYIYEVMGYESLGNGEYTYLNNNDQEVRVTGAMKTLAGKTIGEISNPDTINNLKLYEIMDYHYNELDGNYYEDYDGTNYTNKVTGAMKVIAGKSINEISNPDTINSIKLYEVMNYYYNSQDGEYYKNYDGITYSDKITGAMKTLAGKALDEISDPDLINNFYVYEIMGYYYNSDDSLYYENYNGTTYSNPVTGIMKNLAGKKINELDDAGAFNNVTVADAIGYYLNTADGKYYQNYNSSTEVYTGEVTGIYAHIADAEVGNLSTRINDLTVGKVLDMDIDDVSGVIKALYNIKIKDLSNEDTINGIYIYQVMDYYENGGKYYQNYDGTTYSNEVTGAMKALAGKTIGQLSDPNTINNLYVYEILGYYENGGKYYQNYDGTTYSNEVTGAMKALAGKTVSQLSDPNTINNLKVYEVLGYYENGGKYYTTFDGTTYSNEVSGAIKALAGKSIGELNDKDTGINSITLGEILDINGTTTGVINALKDFKLNELEGKINELQVYQVMGYYKHPTDGKYYQTYNSETQEYSNQVTGIMGAIAGTSVNNLDGTIETLTAVEVLGSDCKLLNIIDESERDTVLVTDLSDKLVDEINNSTIEDLVINQIITGVDTNKPNYQLIKDLTMLEVIDMVLQ